MSRLVSEKTSNLLRKNIKINMIWFDFDYYDFAEEIGSTPKNVSNFLMKTTKMQQKTFDKYFNTLIEMVKLRSNEDTTWGGCALSIALLDLRFKANEELSPIRKNYTS